MNVKCEMEDPDGERLMMSSMYGDASKVKSLVDGGVNVDYVSTGSGMTALMWAASEGHVDVSKILIDAGANVSCELFFRYSLSHCVWNLITSVALAFNSCR